MSEVFHAWLEQQEEELKRMEKVLTSFDSEEDVGSDTRYLKIQVLRSPVQDLKEALQCLRQLNRHNGFYFLHAAMSLRTLQIQFTEHTVEINACVEMKKIFLSEKESVTLERFIEFGKSLFMNFYSLDQIIKLWRGGE